MSHNKVEHKGSALLCAAKFLMILECFRPEFWTDIVAKTFEDKLNIFSDCFAFHPQVDSGGAIGHDSFW
jgi:hypothetical protein